MLKGDMMQVFARLYEGGKLGGQLNQTYLTLIPKRQGANCFNDFWPISLINGVYKIVARVLSKRLAGVIGDVVEEHQFAFLPGRQLPDCVLVANEVVDAIRRREHPTILFKADFQKAYDSVDWLFLDLVMSKMGFLVQWRG